MNRVHAPVFVVGCPRSGTTLLYNMLLSSGNFAVYLAESNVFNLLLPRFGNPNNPSTRQRLVDVWLQSKLFRASFLDPNIRARLLADCNSGGDFLRIVMGEMAKAQGVARWADNSPEELLHVRTIKEQIPDALFIHMIRDGRDVALSLNARPYRWIRPFSWDTRNGLLVTGIFWEWMVQRGRRECRRLNDDHMEVRFEDLQAQPQATLNKIGEFIQQDLDYERIQQVGIGSVREPNTSFKGDPGSPVGRWKHKMGLKQLATFEALVGATLQDSGYSLAAHSEATNRLTVLRMKVIYRLYLDLKFWFKNSALGRAYLGPLSGEQIDNTVIAKDPAAKKLQQGESLISK